MNSKINIGKLLGGLLIVTVVGVLLWYFRSTVLYILVSAVLAIIGVFTLIILNTQKSLGRERTASAQVGR